MLLNELDITSNGDWTKLEALKSVIGAAKNEIKALGGHGSFSPSLTGSAMHTLHTPHTHICTYIQMCHLSKCVNKCVKVGFGLIGWPKWEERVQP